MFFLTSAHLQFTFHSEKVVKAALPKEIEDFAAHIAAVLAGNIYDDVCAVLTKLNVTIPSVDSVTSNVPFMLTLAFHGGFVAAVSKQFPRAEDAYSLIAFTSVVLQRTMEGKYMSGGGFDLRSAYATRLEDIQNGAVMTRRGELKFVKLLKAVKRSHRVDQ